MSAAPASGAAPTAKATATDATTTPPKEQKPAAALEEDDEFEDFPVEGVLIPLHKSSLLGIMVFMRDGQTETNAYSEY